MRKRISCYVGPQLGAYLEARAKGDAAEAGGGSRSAALDTLAGRYAEVVRRHMPTLRRSEWCAILDALNGVWLRDPPSALLTSWAEVYDSDRLNGLGRKWGCDAKALAEAMQKWDYATCVAVVDAVERWWSDPEAAIEDIPAVVGAEHVTEG